MTQMTTAEMLTGIRGWALSKFVTASVGNLINYYLKSETYSKTEVNTLVDAIKQFRYELAATLPEPPGAGTMGIIYLVPSANPKQQNIKDEFITVLESGTYKWEQIGSTSINLSNYYTKGQTDSAISAALNSALAAYTTTAGLTTLLAAKQDAIQDLADIRRGATAGATAVQPAVMSAALVAAVAESGVYDVTANNDGTKFASLSTLLSDENLGTLIPVAARKGGMSIKFVLSSGNKYVQYRLKSNTFSTDTEDWEDESTEVQFHVMVEALAYLYNENKALHELLTGKDNAVLPYIKAQTIECVDKMTMGVPDVLESNVAGAPSAANVPDNWNEATMNVWDGCPRRIGQQYVDKASGKVYYAIKVTGSTGDWVVLN